MSNKLNNIGKEKITLANFKKRLKDLGPGFYVYQIKNRKNGKRKIYETQNLIKRITVFTKDYENTSGFNKSLKPEENQSPEDFEITILKKYPDKEKAKAAKKHFKKHGCFVENDDILY